MNQDVCLVCVPFFNIQRPSLSLSLLKSSLDRVGISSSVSYANFRFAEKIGVDAYWFISTYSQSDLLGEWIFSQKAFSGKSEDDIRYFDFAEKSMRSLCSEEELDFYLKGDSFPEYFKRLREHVSGFVDREADRILSCQPKIVGCSSTYQEHCASLSILRRIREMSGDIVTIMGGGNCEGLPGIVTHRHFNWIDYVVSGEAEKTFPALCTEILQHGGRCTENRLPAGIIGPLHRDKNKQLLSQQIGRGTVLNMDESPVPDYEDYFITLDNSPIKDFIRPALVFESSRGCWWGQRNPCSFCGFNGMEPSYRSKSPERVISELAFQSQSYNMHNYFVADRILDMNYLKTVFPKISKLRLPYTFMFETKSNLSREQVEIMADAGVRFIQPGVESLHDDLLALLNKGSRGVSNIELLKWTREFGINSIWLLLYDIPGERDSWYDDMAGIIPSIIHLQPPNKSNRIYFLRFSEYYNNQEKYNLQLEPCPAYSHVYPLKSDAINDIAYFFETRRPFGKTGTKEGLRLLLKMIRSWQDAWIPFRSGLSTEPPSLTMHVEAGNMIRIHDTRFDSCGVWSTLTDTAAAVYTVCDTAKTLDGILNELDSTKNIIMDTSAVASIIDTLIGNKLMVKMKHQYLALAVRESEKSISWKFCGGELYPDKIYQAFSANRRGEMLDGSLDCKLEDMFGKK
jgi:ribosomal peptide maturation radical SAM protein 1